MPRITEGFWVNVQILVFAAVLILVAGLGLALLRTLRGPVFVPLRALATAYVDLFRGLPLIIVLLVGFGVPGLRLQRAPTSPFTLGTVAIVLTYSAVHPSQRAAARSLGLSYAQTMRLVVLPQGVRWVVPPLLNGFVALQKDVGLDSILGTLVDAVRAAQIETACTACERKVPSSRPYACILPSVLADLAATPADGTSCRQRVGTRCPCGYGAMFAASRRCPRAHGHRRQGHLQVLLRARGALLAGGGGQKVPFCPLLGLRAQGAVA